MGPVLILAILFSLVEKLAGTSGDIWEGSGRNGMHNVRRAGHWFHWKGQGYFQVFLGWSRPCPQLEIGLPGLPCAWCHFQLPVSLLWSLSESSVLGHWFNL